MSATALNRGPQGALINDTIVQGETYALSIVWKTGDPAEPVDLTGHTAEMTLRIGSGPATLTLTEGEGITLGGDTGEVSATLTSEQTAGLTPRKYSRVLKVTSPGGIVSALVRGTLEILED